MCTCWLHRTLHLLVGIHPICRLAKSGIILPCFFCFKFFNWEVIDITIGGMACIWFSNLIGTERENCYLVLFQKEGICSFLKKNKFLSSLNIWSIIFNIALFTILTIKMILVSCTRILKIRTGGITSFISAIISFLNSSAISPCFTR